MLVLGLLIGIYSYAIFLLGLLRQINFTAIFLITFILILISFKILEKKIYTPEILKKYFNSKEKIFIFAFLFVFGLVNLIGALGPETSFDATWYHLTIPKIFINENNIFFIKDNLFYYSLMPKLTEMLYLSSLVISNEILAKVIHYFFGIATCIVTYKIARLYLNKLYSLIASMVFYSNLVVAWLSITAFADLSRAFFESLALFCFLIYTKGFKKYLILSAIFLGLAMSTKILSILSLLIFIVLIFAHEGEILKHKVKSSLLFFSISILTAGPWYLFSFLNSGNPFYPVFSHLLVSDFFMPISIFSILEKFGKFFVLSPDPVSPVYLLLLPFILLNIREIYMKAKTLLIYVFFSLAVLIFTPISGGGRFIVQFLPAYSVIVILALTNLRDGYIKKLIIYTIILVTILNIAYRFVANYKYLPVITGYETKENFLLNNLNFTFGDFYDEGNQIKNIVKQDLVLIIGMHNLFYVNFNFTLQEKNGKNIKYILVQEGTLPKKYTNSVLVYRNEHTRTKLYRSNDR